MLANCTQTALKLIGNGAGSNGSLLLLLLLLLLFWHIYFFKVFALEIVKEKLP